MSGIVEGRKWLQARLRALEERLGETEDPTTRGAIEEEISKVRAEIGAGRRRWWRWFAFGGRAPEL